MILDFLTALSLTYCSGFRLMVLHVLPQCFLTWRDLVQCQRNAQHLSLPYLSLSLKLRHARWQWALIFGSSHLPFRLASRQILYFPGYHAGLSKYDKIITLTIVRWHIIINILLKCLYGNKYACLPPPQGGQDPPQSTSSSSPFRIPSSHVSSGKQGSQLDPPQSTSSSSWFCIPSIHVSQIGQLGPPQSTSSSSWFCIVS